MIDLIFIHDAGESREEYSDFREAVEARGGYAFGLDLMGHGQYKDVPFALPPGWTWSHCDPGGQSLWGVGLGAYEALHAATEKDTYINAVVAFAPLTEAIIRESMSTWDVEIDPDFLWHIEPADLHEVVKRAPCPVLYVHARDDEHVPLSVSERLHQLTPRSELVVLESGGHSGPARDPAVHKLTLDWLERVLSTAE